MPYIMYDHGFYFIEGNRLYCSSRKLPTGFDLDINSMRHELTAFSDILGTERYGYSFQLKGTYEPTN
jgi:NADH/NAD ratio-sensing transcriptional regulator Rex